MNVKELLSTRYFKAGYEVREVLLDCSDYGGDDFVMKSAYSPAGHYIGNPKDAHRLCIKRGIAPEVSHPDNEVCSIGYCKNDGKWYGWSHRAIYGFKPGSTCKMGSCGFLPSNKVEFRQDLARWYRDDNYIDLFLKYRPNGIAISYKVKPENGDPPIPEKGFEKYPSKWGRGEWTAKNLTDARQMAIDFADGVS